MSKINELREARKRAGLTIPGVAAVSKVKQKTWERWEATPGTVSSIRSPEYAFQFLRCYEILKKHDLLDELLASEK